MMIVRHLVTDVPVASAQATAETALALLRQRMFASTDAILVTDREGRLAGAVTLDAVVRAPSGQLLDDLADHDYPRVGPNTDQEDVAREALMRQASSVAVVDREDRPLGIVPAHALLSILREEHVEDLHRLAGIQRESVRDREALEGPPMRRARHRLPWLLLGLAGSMAAAMIMSRFEGLLASDLTITFFIPAIVYLADAIGTQTEAIAVRGLSISRVPLRHLLANELRTGIVIGAILALFAFPMIVLVFGDPRLAAAVSASILAAGSVATTIGLLLPWLLHRMGYDPAFGSGPVATIIQDVTSLVIYFLVATSIVH